MNLSDLKKNLHNLLDSQELSVLATQSHNFPYTNLIAFSPINSYKELLFATLKTTSKYKNLKTNKNVSILFDDRKNDVSDFSKAITVTALGKAQEVDKQKYKELFLNKHPYLSDFINNPDCVLMKIIVEKYIMVEKFQNKSIIVP